MAHSTLRAHTRTIPNDEGSAFVILGDQLFPLELTEGVCDIPVFMAEDYGLCTRTRHHKAKIVFFLAAMRAYAEELRAAGADVYYHSLDEPDEFERSYEEKLHSFIKNTKTSKIVMYEIEDLYMEKRIVEFCSDHSIALTLLPSPMFLCSHDEFKSYLANHKPFLKTFYESQRRKYSILMEDGEPSGGKFSFDEDNRKKLPKKNTPPAPPQLPELDSVVALKKAVTDQFSDHPGSTDSFWLPITRDDARQWLKTFFEERFEHFGTYEDALSSRSEFVYHSALSPLLNCGLLTPHEVLRGALEHAEQLDIPLNSVEGFIRQIIGWREFVRGIYRNYGETLETENFWQHERQLSDSWYSGETGIEPLDHCIKKALTLGYNHHIERLMVISNMMLLCEIKPQQVCEWFMEHYVDSSDWVMAPNVYGMGQFSAGGLFATKPYICGSNYILKMSDFKKGTWCKTVDGLYWRFIEKHLDFFKSNPRLSMMASMLDRLDSDRKTEIFEAAESFLETHTVN